MPSRKSVCHSKSFFELFGSVRLCEGFLPADLRYLGFSIFPLLSGFNFSFLSVESELSRFEETQYASIIPGAWRPSSLRPFSGSRTMRSNEILRAELERAQAECERLQRENDDL